MEKKLDLSKSVYELVTEYPEVADIMKSLGFSEITNKVMLNSVGKIMTIPKGAKMKNVDMFKIVQAFMDNGFTLVGEMPNIAAKAESKEEVQDALNSNETSNISVENTPLEETKNSTISEVQENETVQPTSNSGGERVEQLKGFLRRLGDGEHLESVRSDFAGQFQNVAASEIMAAEQGLMKEGTPLEEVQKLCDLHSALFHGSTIHEQMEEEHAKVEASIAAGDTSGKLRDALVTAGHPLRVLTEENQRIETLIVELKEKIKAKTITDEDLTEIRQLSIHYAKKGDLLFPHLKTQYDIVGPSLVMWTVDSEIRDELGKLAKETNRNDAWYERLDADLTRAQEMIFKEQNILFPLCTENFQQDEWYKIYEDAKQYTPIFGVIPGEWAEAETFNKNIPVYAQPFEIGDVVLAGGSMSVPALSAMLNTMPIEVTFVDENNINRYFNDNGEEKIFKRPTMAIGREVFSCHPPKIEPIVRGIVESFRDGSRDNVGVWMEKGDHTVYVNYLAVRDKKNKFLGTLELVQNMDFAKKHFLKQ